MDLFSNIKIGGETLTSTVELDATLIELSKACDYTFDGTSTFTVPEMIPPSDYKVGLIVGGSGTGKSSLLKHFGETCKPSWDSTKAVASQVDPKLLMRMGLSSIPSLCRPYHVLSEGEKHRADIAFALENGYPVVDEFTSVVHRDLARSICMGLRRTIDAMPDAQLVLATCHEDVAQWLCPDWVFNTNVGKLTEGRSERRPLVFRLSPCSIQAWPIFSRHHYMTSEINHAARCWLLINDESRPCGFSSAIPFPRRGFKNAWREHRTVILPDYQGMGLGSRASNAVADMFYKRGCRYFSKTAHPHFGEYRNHSPLWRATSMNMVSRTKSYTAISKGEKQMRLGAYTRFDYLTHADRVCYSHEYVGDRSVDVESIPKTRKKRSSNTPDLFQAGSMNSDVGESLGREDEAYSDVIGE